MRFSKMRDPYKIWISFIFLIAILFLAIQLHAQSKGKIERVKVSKEAVPKSAQGLKMVGDVLDAVGGKSESDNFKMRISAGGQPSPIGKSQGTAFNISAGYVYATFVLHGDLNGDGVINVGDVVYLISYLYRGGPAPQPLECGDVNCDGVVDLGDVVYLISYLYRGGPPPCGP